MAGRPPVDLHAVLRRGNLADVRAALRADPASARSPRLVTEAGRLAWREGLALLVRAGADLNASWRGYHPLHALIQDAPHARRVKPSSERLNCLDWMLAHGADPDLAGAWPPARALVVAAFVGERAYVDRLVAGGAAVNGFVCAALADVRGVRRAIGADPAFAVARDVGGLTALQCCAGSRLGGASPSVSRALTEVASLLADHGADPHAKARSWSHEIDATYLSVSSGNRELFEWLLDRGGDPHDALVATLWNRRLDWAESALAHGADPNRAAEAGRPLLNELTRWGQVEPALWLLARGADPNAKDGRGWTAVHQAASRGNERLLRAMLDAGGDWSRPDALGQTPQDVVNERHRERLRRAVIRALLR